MYAKYVTNATSTLANVIADIAALLCGGSIASLSASCDKVNSTLVSTVAPGWTAHDISGSVANSGRVISAPDASGLTTKYANIYTPSVGTIDVLTYDAFNAGTHTGTNASTAVTSPMNSISLTSVNVIAIWATPRGFYMQGVTVAAGGSGHFEYTRDIQYLIGTTYPCCFALSKDTLGSASSTSLGQTSRMKNLTAAGDTTGSTAAVALGCITTKFGVGSKISGVINAQIRDNTEALYMELRPLYAMSLIYGSQQRQVPFGKVYDILECTFVSGANTLDTFSDGTDTYSYIVIDANTAMALKNS